MYSVGPSRCSRVREGVRSQHNNNNGIQQWFTARTCYRIIIIYYNNITTVGVCDKTLQTSKNLTTDVKLNEKGIHFGCYKFEGKKS